MSQVLCIHLLILPENSFLQIDLTFVFALLYRIVNFPMHIEMADYWSLLTKPGRKTSCQMMVSLIISIWRENNAGIFSADISVISYIFSKNQTVHPEFMQRKALFFRVYLGVRT